MGQNGARPSQDIVNAIEEQIDSVKQALHAIEYDERTYEQRKASWKKTIQEAQMFLDRLEERIASAPRRRIQLEKRLLDLEERRKDPAFNPKMAKAHKILARLKSQGIDPDVLKAALEQRVQQLKRI